MDVINIEKIKMVITDFDGIITDNCLYVDNNGNMTRKINFKDVMAFSILQKNGIKTAIISGESNAAIEILAKKFDIKEIHQNIRNKIQVLKDIVEKYSLSKEEFLYIGDDINDYEALMYSKNAFTVPEAVDKIKSIPHIKITKSPSGAGAFREVVDILIKN